MKDHFYICFNRILTIVFVLLMMLSSFNVLAQEDSVEDSKSQKSTKSILLPNKFKETKLTTHRLSAVENPSGDSAKINIQKSKQIPTKNSLEAKDTRKYIQEDTVGNLLKATRGTYNWSGFTNNTIYVLSCGTTHTINGADLTGTVGFTTEAGCAITVRLTSNGLRSRNGNYDEFYIFVDTENPSVANWYSSTSPNTSYTSNTGLIILDYSNNCSYSSSWTITINATCPKTLTYNTTENCSDSPTRINGLYSCNSRYVTLSSVVPVCPDGCFAGWATNASGTGTIYQPGGSYYLSSNTTLYAIYTPKHTLTYNTTANCSGAMTIPSVSSCSTATVTPAVPTCTGGGSFREWNTRADGNGTSYSAGDEVDLTSSDVTLYAIYCSSAYHVSINNCSETSGGICYIDVCSPPTSVTLSATSSDMTIATYRWAVNAHDGNVATIYSTASPSVSIGDVQGYDVQLTVANAAGCKASAKARIRVSDGISEQSSYSISQQICAGSTSTITIGTGSTENIQVVDQEVNVNATLGEGVRTFIPDGPNCEEGLCYESSVTFTDFEDGEIVENADDINYLRINLEHSFIGDMQIKLTCPNGQSVIVLEDRFAYNHNGKDDYEYEWPYLTYSIYAIFKVYENCNSPVATSYIVNFPLFVVQNGNTYSLTVEQDEATHFPRNTDFSVIRTYVANNISTLVAQLSGLCIGNNYYLYYRLATTQDESDYDFRSGWSLTTPPFSLGFGAPSAVDGTGSNVCSAAANTPGVGADYCWSNNSNYSYASGSGYVYETSNHQAGTTIQHMVKPSNMGNMSQIYHPRESFTSLVGCPLNGTWTVSVCDGEGADNGYIFNWEISLTDDKLPDNWGYDIEFDYSSLSCTGVTWTTSGDNIVLTPAIGQASSYDCNVVLYDNLGCPTNVRTIFTIVEPTITLNSGCVASQSLCEGKAISNINYTIGGIATGASISWSPSNPGMSFTHSGNVYTISGTPNATGTYTYTITTTQATGCTAKTTTGTITVYANPTASISGTTTVCKNSTTQLQVSASSGTPAYTYSWSGTPTGTASGSPSGVTFTTGSLTANTTYTVVVTDQHGCKATVNQPITVLPLVTAPTLTATSCDRQVTLSWQPATGAASYTIMYGRVNPPSLDENVIIVPNATSPFEATELTNGRDYYFAIIPIGNGTTYCQDNAQGTTVTKAPVCDDCE